MYVGISLKKLFFKNYSDTKSAIIYENQVIMTNNLSSNYIGNSKAELLAQHPEANIINVNKYELWQLAIKPLQKLANDLPDMYFLLDIPGILQFTCIFLPLKSYIDYFKTLSNFRKFLTKTFIKHLNIDLNIVISENPIANAFVGIISEKDEIFTKNSIIKKLEEIPISNCFFLSKKDLLNLNHLQVYTVRDLIHQFSSEDIRTLLTEESYIFFNHLLSKSSKLNFVKISPISVILYNFSNQIHDLNTLIKSILTGFHDLSSKLKEVNLTCKEVLLILDNQFGIHSIQIPFSNNSKENECFCRNAIDKVILPINSYCIIPTKISEIKQLKIFVTKNQYLENLEKATATGSATPELCFKYMKASSFNTPKANSLILDISDVSDYPPIIFTRPIQVKIIGLINKGPRYILLKNSKLKIIKSEIHSIIFPDWWNCRLKYFRFCKREYHKVLVETGLILWIAIINENAFLHGIWS